MLSRLGIRSFSLAKAAAAKTKLLTQEQAEEFRRVGYLVLKNALPQQYTSALQTWAKTLEDIPEIPGKWMKYYEVDRATNKRRLCRVENFAFYFKDIEECVNGFLTDVASDCFGEQSVSYKEKLNFKYPYGDGFAAHQDQLAFETFNLDVAISILIPIDPNTAKSGGLEFVSGRNQRVMLPKNSDGCLRADIEESMHWEPVDAFPGDVVAFDSYAPHRSGLNSTNFTRRNIYFTYNALSKGSLRARYTEEKRRMFPPESERDPNKDYSEGAKIYNITKRMT